MHGLVIVWFAESVGLSGLGDWLVVLWVFVCSSVEVVLLRDAFGLVEGEGEAGGLAGVEVARVCLSHVWSFG